MSNPPTIKVGILGATGTVGQKFITLLENHPFLKIHALGASPRSAGQLYQKAVKWKQSTPIPALVRDIVVSECNPLHFSDCGIVFSGLDASVAGDIGQFLSQIALNISLLRSTHLYPSEFAFRAADLAVFSNSKNHRRGSLIPLVVPHVNVSHLSVLPRQRAMHAPPLKKGFIVTNANCSITTVVVPLAALEKAFGPLESVIVTTMQAISGAGYPGVPSLDIFDNVVPYIGGEEEKMEWEALKILGEVREAPESDGFAIRDKQHSFPLRLSASCNRVPVLDGHTACVSVKFSRQPPPTPERVRQALASYTSPVQQCHSAPKHTIKVFEEPDRPQPRLDREFERGAGVCVGRVRECGVLDIKFVVMANNVSIGAAMSSILNAEYSVQNRLVLP
jgi:aspartate-semialdehyde dehydrogenase